VPATKLLGEEGEVRPLAQDAARPGAHPPLHALDRPMRVALELRSKRELERKAFGRNLARLRQVQGWIAEGRMGDDQARLLCLRAAG